VVNRAQHFFYANIVKNFTLFVDDDELWPLSSCIHNKVAAAAAAAAAERERWRSEMKLSLAAGNAFWVVDRI
jgi:hypothetical protein